MAGSSLFALIDDIATILDDVALMSKVAAKKTAGVLGDDLALNAQQVAGVRADRELPVVWAVALGSLKNKAILVPAALAISAFLPAAITPLLMIGGLYLCFEGFEKIAHGIMHKEENERHKEELAAALSDPNADMVAIEKDKIKGAVRTDFILSAEIIVISLGTLAGRTFLEQLLTLVAIALIMTIGVYGLVGGIVKLDDLGLALNRDQSDGSWAKVKRNVGTGILRGAPYLMKFLSVAGTAAMFLVGGGILVHGLPPLHHFIEPYAQGTAGTLVSMLFDAVVGILIGIGVLLAVKLVSRLRKPKTLPTG